LHRERVETDGRIEDDVSDMVIGAGAVVDADRDLATMFPHKRRA
jgi:hypothetical protein